MDTRPRVSGRSMSRVEMGDHSLSRRPRPSVNIGATPEWDTCRLRAGEREKSGSDSPRPRQVALSSEGEYRFVSSTSLFALLHVVCMLSENRREHQGVRYDDFATRWLSLSFGGHSHF